MRKHVIKIEKYLDLVLLVFLIVIAILPRVFFLTETPPGLHGDEAWTGIDAIRIQNEGIIEPYVGSALGQPVGPAYLTALIFELFGPSQWSVRFSMALFGIVTIPLFYIFTRQFFDKFPSFWATVTLGLSLYHIHYSRIGFMLISAPVFQLLTLILLTLWVKKGKTIYSVLAGLFLGLGIYTYNTFLFFPLIIPLFLYSQLELRQLVSRWKGLLFFVCTFLIVAFPLFRVIFFQSDYYFSHARTVSSISRISNDGITIPEIHTLNKDFLIRTYQFFTGYHIDYGDGFGKHSSFNYILLLVFFLTILYVLHKKKRKHSFAVFSLLICLLSLYLTVDGFYRRQIIALIFLYYLLAVFIQFLLSISDKFKTAAKLYISIILISISLYSVVYYFRDFSQDSESKYIFAYSLTKVAYEMESKYPKEHYAFYSQRWSCKYETLIFLLENTCDNYSKEFGDYKKPEDLKNINTFVFMDSYIADGKRLIKSNSFESTTMRDDTTNEIIGLIVNRK